MSHRPHCDALADLIVEGLETGEPGTVRALVDDHVADCPHCAARGGALRLMASGLDPIPARVGAGFVTRVMTEVRGEVQSSRDRMPPIWQVFGAAGLFVVLATVVIATQQGENAAWHTRALTGFVDQALGFLGVMSHGITDMWESVAPGRALPILIGCAVVATVLNVAFAVRAVRRARRTVE
jgi:hypothetical protein